MRMGSLHDAIQMSVGRNYLSELLTTRKGDWWAGPFSMLLLAVVPVHRITLFPSPGRHDSRSLSTLNIASRH